MFVRTLFILVMLVAALYRSTLVSHVVVEVMEVVTLFDNQLVVTVVVMDLV